MSRSKFEGAVRDQLGFLGSTRGSAGFQRGLILKRLGCLDALDRGDSGVIVEFLDVDDTARHVPGSLTAGCYCYGLQC